MLAAAASSAAEVASLPRLLPPLRGAPATAAAAAGVGESGAWVVLLPQGVMPRGQGAIIRLCWLALRGD
jgi:hypothetical protein